MRLGHRVRSRFRVRTWATRPFLVAVAYTLCRIPHASRMDRWFSRNGGYRPARPESRTDAIARGLPAVIGSATYARLQSGRGRPCVPRCAACAPGAVWSVRRSRPTSPHLCCVLPCPSHALSGARGTLTGACRCALRLPCAAGGVERVTPCTPASDERNPRGLDDHGIGYITAGQRPKKFFHRRLGACPIWDGVVRRCPARTFRTHGKSGHVERKAWSERGY